MKPGLILIALVLAFPLGVVVPSVAEAADQSCNAAKTNYIDQTPAVFTQLGIAGAQRLSDGGVRVAVIDSGVDSGNAHLKGVVVAGKSYVGSGDGRADSVGQGTALAGQIAAQEVKGSGVVGIATKATIVPVQVYDSEQTGKPSAANTATAIRWAAQEGKASIIVVSDTLSTTTDSPALKSAVSAATTRGALVVAAAGDVTNTESDDPVVRFPAGYDEVLSVTALGADGNIASNAQGGTHVGLAAPGAQVLTAFRAAGDCMFGASQASTTYAAGYAAGIAALVAAAHPQETPADWRYRLLATALRPTTDQRNNTTGWGVIAPYDAINFINDGTRLGPANPRFPAPSAPAAQPGQKPNVQAADDSAMTVAAAVGLSALALALAGVLVDLLRRRRDLSTGADTDPSSDRS
jgi:membrane-anchored mycosin MYCP